MKKSIKQALSHFIKTGNVTTKSAEITADNLSVSSLPDEYNSVPYDTYVNGVRVKTVGEYKAKLEETYWQDAYE